MKQRILQTTFLAFISSMVFSQAPGPNEAFAFTYSVPGSGKIQDIKLVDLHTGIVTRSLYENKQSFRIMSAVTGRLLHTGDQLAANDSLLQPLATTVAASAYDEKNNRLYFTPLGVNQLRYIDLSQPGSTTFNYVDGIPFGASRGLFDVPNQITRMTIDAEGIGYALSNDGNHLIRFTTSGKPVITDLGAVADNSINQAVSIHTSCTSAGGDIVSAVNGSLVLVTANNYLFSIDVNSKVATYQGLITGLPQGFTSNGAAVDKNGELIVGCALDVQNNGYYKVDMGTLKAVRAQGKSAFLASSDLANSNILGQVAVAKNTSLQSIRPMNATQPRNFSIYPNPVRSGLVRMTFINFAKGNYEVQIQDMLGTQINKWSLTIYSAGQVEQFNAKLFQATAQGVYIVRVLDKSKQTSISRKVVVIKD